MCSGTSWSKSSSFMRAKDWPLSHEMRECPKGSGLFANLCGFFVTAHGGMQRSHLTLGERAMLADIHIERERAVAYPLDFFRVMADGLKHLPDLPVSAFDQRDFVPRIVCFANQLNFCRRGFHPPAR